MLGIGIMNLTPSDQVGKHSQPLDDAFLNPVCDGVAVRTQWAKVQPSMPTVDFSFLASGKRLAAQYNKKWSALVTAGTTTPQWVYDHGAYKFTLHTPGEPIAFMPLPWDKVFQAKWSSFLGAFFTNFGGDPNLKYVVMGDGRRAESYFVTSAVDQAALDAKARADGYVDGMAAWQAGTQWIIDQYAKLCHCWFLLDLGAPAPTDEGRAALQAVCNYADQKYRGRFGVKSDGLAVNGPPVGSIGVTEVQALSPKTCVGYQFGLPQKTDVQAMNNSLARGMGFGAHFIEVYQGDCDYQPHWPALRNASADMKQM
jgi:hypothetical protein